MSVPKREGGRMYLSEASFCQPGLSASLQRAGSLSDAWWKRRSAQHSRSGKKVKHLPLDFPFAQTDEQGSKQETSHFKRLESLQGAAVLRERQRA